MSSDRDRNADISAASILIYEDDDALVDEILLACREHGLSAAFVADESELLERIAMRQSRLLILDRMVRGIDSLAIVERFRRAGHLLPVLVISSLASVDDRILGLKTGGDDYLVKPFAMGELIARIEALMRRATDTRSVSLVVGPLMLDLIGRTATRDGRAIALLPREFSLLEYFMRHAGQTVTRAMLLEHVWNFKSTTQTNVVDVHVGNLRRKIEVDGEARLLESIRGVGFRLATSAE